MRKMWRRGEWHKLLWVLMQEHFSWAYRKGRDEHVAVCCAVKCRGLGSNQFLGLFSQQGIQWDAGVNLSTQQ